LRLGKFGGGGKPPRGTSPGGRGGESEKIEPNCAPAGAAASSVARTTDTKIGLAMI
jgi:hypothetical protein